MKRSVDLLSNLIIALKNYPTVLVTGPQRSGTTITTIILAKELGYEYIDEGEHGAYDVFSAFKIYDTKTKFVMHGPGLSAYAQIFPGAIVFVKRSTKEIIQSEKRISWDLSVTEKRRYFSDCPETHIADLKWEMWKKFQQLDKRFFDLNYNDLETHELWVDKEKRKDFGGRQTFV